MAFSQAARISFSDTSGGELTEAKIARLELRGESWEVGKSSMWRLVPRTISLSGAHPTPDIQTDHQLAL
jgi:hypothetical protein